MDDLRRRGAGIDMVVAADTPTAASKSSASNAASPPALAETAIFSDAATAAMPGDSKAPFSVTPADAARDAMVPVG